MVTATCEACGSNDLRRKRAGSVGRRLYRAVTGRQRYRCGACHHRGWTALPLPSETPAPSRASGRPLEARDFEEARRVRRRRLLAVTVAVSLGAVLAALIGWAAS